MVCDRCHSAPAARAIWLKTQPSFESESPLFVSSAPLILHLCMACHTDRELLAYYAPAVLSAARLMRARANEAIHELHLRGYSADDERLRAQREVMRAAHVLHSYVTYQTGAMDGERLMMPEDVAEELSRRLAQMEDVHAES